MLIKSVYSEVRQRINRIVKNMAKYRGAVAAGHELTVKTAETILKEGGNAFDAVVAAHLAACFAEPVLSSLGGGGFMLAHTSDNKDVLYDFFVQTPVEKAAPELLEFYPIQANFGSAKQEFHIGAGSAATPGSIKGLFAIHRELCTMPMKTLAEPAVRLAKKGVRVNGFQSYIFDVIKPIYASNPETGNVFKNRNEKAELPGEGDVIKMPMFADFLENVALEGDRLFYEGEVARSVAEHCSDGAGHLQLKDLEMYKTVKRAPLKTIFNGNRLIMNPPPSSAGILIAFALKIFEKTARPGSAYGSAVSLELLANVMEVTHRARAEAIGMGTTPGSLENVLDETFIEMYTRLIQHRSAFSRGTTHISVTDNDGNIAALTTSNGEGCGRYIPGTGIMLNNMLGEEDLNESGFHAWKENERMTSMMAPGILFTRNGDFTAFGSGGSNRIRTAILQVLINILVHNMDFKTAIDSPRLHVEPDHVFIENGFDPDEVQRFLEGLKDYTIWPEKNLFFGGVHAVRSRSGTLDAHGDLRRGGSSVVL